MKRANHFLPFLFLALILAGNTLACALSAATDEPAESETNSLQSSSDAAQRSDEAPARPRLAINSWFYHLGFEPDAQIVTQMVMSQYDLVVLEPIVTDRENRTFPIDDLVAELHDAPHPKIVLAYIDIGQAEDWRTYWEAEWGIGNPAWIVAADPDGWEGNYPVAFWHEEWQEIWLDPDDGYLQQLLDAGFDGIYLDWVEAYSDDNVRAAAEAADVDPEDEMIAWISRLAAYGRAHNPDFIVIGQNAPELVENDAYVALVDGIAQEQTWFDGAADNNPPGDCPLPATEADVDTDAYYARLSAACQFLYDEYPESTLHVSSEWYLTYLTLARDKGLTVLTVDYAVEPANVRQAHIAARQNGFVPFAGERALDTFQPPVLLGSP